jgi:hypothetical protein
MLPTFHLIGDCDIHATIFAAKLQRRIQILCNIFLKATFVGCEEMSSLMGRVLKVDTLKRRHLGKTVRNDGERFVDGHGSMVTDGSVQPNCGMR